MKLPKRVLMSVSVLSIFSLFSLKAEAEEITQTQDSEATIEFEEYTGTTPPKDPTNPEENYEPNPEEGDNDLPDPETANGPLSLDYVSSIDFGKQGISMFDQTYESTTLDPFIQVTDKRAVSDGWNVTVAASPFIHSEDGSELTGVVLEFLNGVPLPVSETNNYKQPTVKGDSIFTDNVETSVASAEANEARDTWLIHWLAEGTSTNNKVKLTIPGGVAKEGTYTSSLTWTLTNAPR